MDPNLKEKTLERLTKAENILVSISKSADFDALAAGLALYLSLLKLGKTASIQAKSPSVLDAQNLYAVDKIGKPAGSKNLVIVVENAVDTVDKVTYALDGSRLKIVVHPFSGAQPVEQEQVTFEKSAGPADFIFALGYTSPDQLKQEVTHDQNIDSNVWLINISKKDMGQIFAQLNVFDNQAASLSEITARLFQELALPLDEDISYNLYTGIAWATHNFSPNHSSPSSFESAAWLIKFGAGKAGLAEQAESRRSNLAQSKPDFQNQPVGQAQQADQTQGAKQEPQAPSPNPFDQITVEEVERREGSQETWLKPPKIYKGSKSFDIEH